MNILDLIESQTNEKPLNQFEIPVRVSLVDGVIKNPKTYMNQALNALFKELSNASEGVRNTTLFRVGQMAFQYDIAAQTLGITLDYDVALELRHAAERCGMEDKKDSVSATIRSAYKAANTLGRDWLAQSIQQRVAEYEQELEQRKAARAEMQDAYPFEIGSNVEIAKHLSRGTFAGCVGCEDKLWRCEENIWTEVSDKEFFLSVAEYDGIPYSWTRDDKPKSWFKICDATVRSVKKSILALLQDPDFFKDAPVGLACKDYFLGVDGRLTRLTPEHRVRHSSDIEIPEGDPDVSLLDKCIEEWFPRSTELEAIRARIYETIGLCAIRGWGRLPRQEMMILTGTGRNGKSVFLNVLKSIVPTHLMSSVTPQNMDNEYYAIQLLGKALNITPEMSYMPIKSTANLKAALQGEDITGRNPYGEPIMFKPTCGFIVATNELPMSWDQTEGFTSRMVILPFRQDFAGREDIYLSDKLKAITGHIIKAAVPYALEAIARGRCTPVDVSKRAVKKWVQVSSKNYTPEFLKENFELCERGYKNQYMSAAELYARYREYVIACGDRPAIRKVMLQQVEEARVFRKRIKRVTYRGQKLYPLVLKES